MSYNPPTSSNASLDVQAIRAALRCGRVGCPCMRPNGNVHCPTHDDEHPSLSVTEHNGHVRIKCFAGCRWEDVVAALHERGLWPDPKPIQRKRSEIVATYDYVDEDGRLLFQVVRYHPKKFRQRRPDGAGGWIYHLGETPRVLYRLPDVLAAVRAGRTIYIVEGEKDADNLANLGLVATTNPGGAGKWREEYTEALRGARVVVIPDNDDAGRQHAEQVARSLSRVAAEVRVLELPGLPPKGDVSDWLKAGGTLEELERLAASVPVWTPAAPGVELVLAPLSTVEAKSVEWLWRGWIPRGRLTLVAGNPGAGKSFFTQAIAAAVTQGTPLPGENTRREPATVILISLEDDPADTLRPRLEEMEADLGRVFVLRGVLEREVGPDGALHTSERTLVLPRDVGALQEAIKRTQAALVVIDPLVAVQDAAIDSHRQAAMRQLLRPLHLVAQETGAAIVAVAHLRKTWSETALYRVGGSIDLVAAARVVIIVAPDPEDQTPNPNDRRRIACVAKSNVGARPDPVAFSLWEGRFGWGPTPVLRGLTAEALLETPPVGTEERGALEEAADFLREVLAEGPRLVKEIYREAREAGITEITLRRAKSRLGVRAAKAKGGGWLWELPKEGTAPSQECQGDPSKMIIKAIIDDHLDDRLDDHLGNLGILGAEGSPPPDQECQECQGDPAKMIKAIINDHLATDHLGILAGSGSGSASQQECQDDHVKMIIDDHLADDHLGTLGNLGILETGQECQAGTIEAGKECQVGILGHPARAGLEEGASREKRRALEEAVGFLRGALARGPRQAKEIQREARAAGIADRTLARAKALLGVKSRKTTGSGPWVWELDRPLPDQGCQEPQSGALGILGPSESDQECQPGTPGNLGNLCHPVGASEEGSSRPNQDCQRDQLGILGRSARKSGLEPDQECQEPRGGSFGILAPSEPDQGSQEPQPSTLGILAPSAPDQGCQGHRAGILGILGHPAGVGEEGSSRPNQDCQEPQGGALGILAPSEPDKECQPGTLGILGADEEVSSRPDRSGEPVHPSRKGRRRKEEAPPDPSEYPVVKVLDPAALENPKVRAFVEAWSNLKPGELPAHVRFIQSPDELPDVGGPVSEQEEEDVEW